MIIKRGAAGGRYGKGRQTVDIGCLVGRLLGDAGRKRKVANLNGIELGRGGAVHREGLIRGCAGEGANRILAQAAGGIGAVLGQGDGIAESIGQSLGAIGGATRTAVVHPDLNLVLMAGHQVIQRHGRRAAVVPGAALQNGLVISG